MGNDARMERKASLRGGAALGLLLMGCVAVCVFVVGAQHSGGPTELAVDCSADPWSPKCHPVSMMDMIDKVGHRARSNAIAQHKLKMQLLAEESDLTTDAPPSHEHHHAHAEHHTHTERHTHAAKTKAVKSAAHKGDGEAKAMQAKVRHLRKEILEDEHQQHAKAAAASRLTAKAQKHVKASRGGARLHQGDCLSCTAGNVWWP